MQAQGSSHADREGKALAFEDVKRENERLRRSVGELSLLNDLAIEIGSAGNLEAVMQAVLRRARAAVSASQGTITLVGDGEEDDTLRTLVRTNTQIGDGHSLRPNWFVLRWMRAKKAPLIINEGDHVGDLSPMDASVRSLLSVPMIAGGRLEGILTVFNHMTGGRFSEADARLLSIIAVQSAQAVQNRRLNEERQKILEIFGRHTAPEIVDEILRRPSGLAGVRLRVCIMFADLRGFSSFAEEETPENVVAFLNEFFSTAIDVVTSHHGIVHQLLGDGFLALFGVPFSYENDTMNAVLAALEIIERLDESIDESKLRSMPLGIGLHTGDVVAGLVGSPLHQEYKVTGDAVNVAARIEDLNKQFKSRLLVSSAVVRSIDTEIHQPTPLGEVVLRGRRTPLEIYRLA